MMALPADASPPTPAVLPWVGRLLRRDAAPAIATVAVTQAVLLFWWLAFYPGLFSPDSVGYIWQSTTDNWNSHHPPAYTSLVWASLELTGGVGALTLVQTVAMAAALGYAAESLRGFGVHGWVAAAAAVGLVAVPPVGTFVICVWKDVPYVICHVLLLGATARLIAGYRQDGKRASRATLLTLGAALTLICLFRQNGFVVVAITVTITVLLLRADRLRLVLAGAAAVAIGLLNTLVLLPTLGVANGAVVAMESFYGDLSVGYAREPASFPAEDQQAMAAVADLDHWRVAANVYNVDPLTYSPEFDRKAAATHQEALLRAWLNLARRSPVTVLQVRAARGAIAWNPFPVGDLRTNPNPWSAATYLDRNSAMVDNPYRSAVTSAPLSRQTYTVGVKLVRWSNDNAPDWLVWMGATWCYVAYVAVAFAGWRLRDHRILVLAAAVAAGQMSVLAFNNLQAARYMAAPFVLGVLLASLLSVRRPQSDEPALGQPAMDQAVAPAPKIAVMTSPPSRRRVDHG